jgi:hypothetical protein
VYESVETAFAWSKATSIGFSTYTVEEWRSRAQCSLVLHCQCLLTAAALLQAGHRHAGATSRLTAAALLQAGHRHAGATVAWWARQQTLQQLELRSAACGHRWLRPCRAAGPNFNHWHMHNLAQCQLSCVQVGLKAAEDTLAAAGRLLSKLTGEKASWTAQAAENARALTTLPACSAAAAAFVTYAASEGADTRAALMADWAGVTCLGLPESFSVARFLASEDDALAWKAEGLQGDSVRFSGSSALLHLPVMHHACGELPRACQKAAGNRRPASRDKHRTDQQGHSVAGYTH